MRDGDDGCGGTLQPALPVGGHIRPLRTGFLSLSFFFFFLGGWKKVGGTHGVAEAAALLRGARLKRHEGQVTALEVHTY